MKPQVRNTLPVRMRYRLYRLRCRNALPVSYTMYRQRLWLAKNAHER